MPAYDGAQAPAAVMKRPKHWHAERANSHREARLSLLAEHAEDGDPSKCLTNLEADFAQLVKVLTERVNKQHAIVAQAESLAAALGVPCPIERVTTAKYIFEINHQPNTLRESKNTP